MYPAFLMKKKNQCVCVYLFVYPFEDQFAFQFQGLRTSEVSDLALGFRSEPGLGLS